MKLGILVLMVGLASAVFLVVLGTSSAESAASSSGAVGRRKYLVEQVGMCNIVIPSTAKKANWLERST